MSDGVWGDSSEMSPDRDMRGRRGTAGEGQGGGRPRGRDPSGDGSTPGSSGRAGRSRASASGRRPSALLDDRPRLLPLPKLLRPSAAPSSEPGASSEEVPGTEMRSPDLLMVPSLRSRSLRLRRKMRSTAFTPPPVSGMTSLQGTGSGGSSVNDTRRRMPPYSDDSLSRRPPCPGRPFKSWESPLSRTEGAAKQSSVVVVVREEGREKADT